MGFTKKKHSLVGEIEMEPSFAKIKRRKGCWEREKEERFFCFFDLEPKREGRRDVELEIKKRKKRRERRGVSGGKCFMSQKEITQVIICDEMDATSVF